MSQPWENWACATLRSRVGTAVAATPGTPRAIVQKLQEAFTTAARDPDLKRRVEENGLTVVTSTPEEMGQLLVKEVADISQLVHALGLVKQ